MAIFKLTALHIALFVSVLVAPITGAQEKEADQLVVALLGNTPLVEDLKQLTDEIGGRPTGSEANLASVDWALKAFEAAGVSARKEAFSMPELWLARSAAAEVSGDVSFEPRVVSMPFSVPTPEDGVTAPLVDGGFGTDDDFRRLGEDAKGAFVLVETHELTDIEGLFRDYSAATNAERRAFAAGVTGVVYMSSRPNNLLYRHNASRGVDNEHPLLVMEREEAQRAMRLLRAGKKLSLTAKIDVEVGGPYESYNVIGEILGSREPEEIVVVGAHLDSWGLGTGANDNACNVAMMIDIARQMKRLGIVPKRTIRFALWNGEEQGFIGSWRYTQAHEDEMDRHVMALSVDIGSGRINGFFTGGRSEQLPILERSLKSVQGLGPFASINGPIVGTDNYDFMMQGIVNLVANHEPHNYGPTYHAESDTFDKVDLRQLRLNTAIVAAVAYGYATLDIDWGRQTRADLEELVRTTDLAEQMRSMGLWDSWKKGQRGRTN
jgi:hypothetical protein